METVAESPVIVTGMHRSGTSILSGMLEFLGVFMGDKKQEDNESVFFLTLNEWLLAQVNASWDNPYNLRFLDDELKSSMLAAIEYFLGGPERAYYLGKERAQAVSSVRLYEGKWGWKDPRNTLLIDLWKTVFPNARIINIYRNPVDVAASLRRRKLQYDRQIKSVIGSGRVEALIRNGTKLQLSVRVADLDEGIRIWEDYVSNAIEAENRFPDTMLSICYETMLDTPGPVLKQVVEFCGLNPRAEQIRACADRLDGSRKYAFLEDKALCDVYSRIKNRPLVEQLGYGGILQN